MQIIGIINGFKKSILVDLYSSAFFNVFSNYSVCSEDLVCILLVSVTSSGKQPPGTAQERDADGVPAMAMLNGSHTEHVWHYDEEFRSGGGSPKPAFTGISWAGRRCS